jgi:4-amino-4-deoxy-L-arabinose transferase-like glycosyltransferase
MSEEPTVLDFVKALLTPWKGAPPPIPPAEVKIEASDISPKISQLETSEQVVSPQVEEPVPQTDSPTSSRSFPWRAASGLAFAIIAQLTLEPGEGRTWIFGLVIYIFAAAWALWATLKGEWVIPGLPDVRHQSDPLTIRQVYLWIGGALSILAFLTLGGNRFTISNSLLWMGAVIFIILAFWLPNRQSSSNLWTRLSQIIARRDWDIKVSRWTIVLLLASAVILFFRVYRLESVPPEMVSDHAEKLLDVWDVLQGNTQVFFTRNTGREGLQMYITAAVIKIFGTSISFSSLKIGTVMAGLITLPFIYLLGVELANRRAGLLAMVFAGIAYWPNVISRVALRFSLYPLFVAPTLYFLIRGLRRSNRNDFILAGLFLGLGLHGYTPFRIVPIVILVAVGLFLLHSQSKGFRKRTLLYLCLLVLVALIVFLPLLRFWIENPDVFNYRALTRVTSAESPLPGTAWDIFKRNLRNALTMFAWSNGEIWPVSIPFRPALGVVSASLFYLGSVLLLVRYIRKRNWLDIFILLSIPLLMLPSILSLAFPSENPTLNRTAGALVPVFLIIGLSLDGFLNGIRASFVSPNGRRIVWVVGVLLLFWSMIQNFDLVFNQYSKSYALSSWNTSEIGAEIHDFTETIGTEDTAFVVAYPHWVDTRLVGINAGFPTRDFAIWPEDFQRTLDIQGTKLFIIKLDDKDSISSLQSIYPNGLLQLIESRIPNKEFYKFFVLEQ